MSSWLSACGWSPRQTTALKKNCAIATQAYGRQMKWAFNQFPVLKSSQTKQQTTSNHPSIPPPYHSCLPHCWSCWPLLLLDLINKQFIFINLNRSHANAHATLVRRAHHKNIKWGNRFEKLWYGGSDTLRGGYTSGWKSLSSSVTRTFWVFLNVNG